MHAVLYLRLSVSQSFEGGPSDSIQRQEADLRALCERQGWTVAGVLIDDGVSGTKVREAATEALRMLRDREADVLAVWKLDRWGRRGAADVADLVAVLDERQDARFVALQDGLDSTQQAWRLIASVLSEVGRAEAENTAARVRAAIRDNRQAGRYVGGTVPFGYEPAAREGGGRTLRPNDFEAAVVRDVAERLIEGQSQAQVLRYLTLERQVATTRSAYRLKRLRGEPFEGEGRGEWSYSGLASVWAGEAVLGRVARSRRAAGPDGPRRVWEVVRDDTGLPLVAFQPILDGETSERVRAVLRDPKRPDRRRGPRRTRAARLLSGVLYCALCDRRLWVTTSGRQAAYVCKSTPRCPGPAMRAENAERAVSERFLTWAEHTRLVEFEEVTEVSDPGVAAELADVREALRTVADELLEDGADTATLLQRLSALKTRRGVLEATPAALSTRFVKTGRTLVEAWAADEGDEHRRGLLAMAIDHAVLHPTESKGHTGYHPERIELRFRDYDEAFGD